MASSPQFVFQEARGPVELSSGKSLGPYQIIAPLGSGGMGEVFRARDSRIGREVAVKVLSAEFASDPDRLKRFQHEARAAGALNHPGLLTLHDLGTHEGQPYLVTELLEGETLRAKLGSGPLLLKKALDYALQIARGLAAAHAGGIVHRDLKPENLFLTKDGRVKILDFGLASLRRADPGAGAADTASLTLTESGMILGTAGYMSPEQARGEKADARSDLFAFGCVLYEMVSGKRAFAGASMIDTLHALLNAEPPAISELRPDTPPALDALVRHCLEKAPAERFQSARDIQFALEVLVTAGAPGSARPQRFSRASLLSVVAVLILIVPVAGWFALRGHTAPPVSYHRLTFQRGDISKARFAADGHTIVYSAAWEGAPLRLHTVREDSPGATALSLPDGRLLAVSSSNEIAMAIGRGFSLATGAHTTLARAPLAGGAARELLDDISDADWSPDGRSLAVVRLLPDRTRIEYPVGKVLFESSSGIICPRVSPRGDRVAFVELESRSDYSRGRVAVVDHAGRRVSLTPVWGTIQGLAWSPRGDEIWFTAAQRGLSKALIAVSLSGRQRPLLNAPGGLTLHDVFRDGRALLSQDHPHVSTQGLAPGATRERDLSWLESTGAADLSSDGKTLLFSEWSEALGSTNTVGIRGMDGSPAVNLGEGYAGALSPDGKWVVAFVSTPKPHVSVLPTGAGQARDLDPGPVTDIDWSDWAPDGQHVVFAGTEPGHRLRAYVQDVGGGPPRPFTPEGIVWGWHLVSPDGRFLIAGLRDTSYLFPLDGSSPRVLPWLRADDGIIRWLADGRSLLIRAPSAVVSARVERLDLATGTRQFVRELAPADPAGVSGIAQIVFTPDLRAYAYTYNRVLCDLYVVEGLH